ncbi:phosphotransferase family protein [Burkholderia pseudomallei]|uniref:Phosphotransferase enzyme family protein n=1 Tax=Burkholderia pseudomallei TaxID=28450 RepID=A0AA40JIC2_BURPE|nr:aminoglycoside phosphotransferase family protein [Burkholderia pseudomallei]KGS72517.1 phosphotransferase enzyme family protein [Burkholderia pseudomallei MSHR5596]KGW78427.1 phosphotransferase enzyme family protein [Burkholderia pseudomallei MSHR2990]KGX17086.1 phosphotransferase enzyme family protein [Burkholderia pseudomallei]
MSRLEHNAYLELHEPLQKMGLLRSGEVVIFAPLTGGVSSDILLATTSTRKFCIKRALTQLKVAELWTAPVERNAAEAAWLLQVGAWLPEHVPAVIGEARADGMFAMDYLPPDTHPVWKAQLSKGLCDAAFAARVGDVLARIHALSAGDRTIADTFANDQTFESIRLDPYFRFTAVKYPQLARRLNALADQTLSTRVALVHGDVSPKNILCSDLGPVFIDAECAWYGDPAFDLAFCLTHLLLKSVWHPEWRANYVRCYDALARAYLQGVDWESVTGLSERCATLIPALLLARVDGKSPVEYLPQRAEKAFVRQGAISLLVNPVRSTVELGELWLRREHE